MRVKQWLQVVLGAEGGRGAAPESGARARRLFREAPEQHARDPKTPRRYGVRATLHATAGGTITRVQLTPLGSREEAWPGQEALHRCLMTTMQRWRLRADSPRQLTVPLRLSR